MLNIFYKTTSQGEFKDYIYRYLCHEIFPKYEIAYYFGIKKMIVVFTYTLII